MKNMKPSEIFGCIDPNLFKEIEPFECVPFLRETTIESNLGKENERKKENENSEA